MRKRRGGSAEEGTAPEGCRRRENDAGRRGVGAEEVAAQEKKDVGAGSTPEGGGSTPRHEEEAREFWEIVPRFNFR